MNNNAAEYIKLLPELQKSLIRSMDLLNTMSSLIQGVQATISDPIPVSDFSLQVPTPMASPALPTLDNVRQEWTEADERLFEEGIRQFGTDFRKITDNFGGRMKLADVMDHYVKKNEITLAAGAKISPVPILLENFVKKNKAWRKREREMADIARNSYLVILKELLEKKGKKATSDVEAVTREDTEVVSSTPPLTQNEAQPISSQSDANSGGSQSKTPKTPKKRRLRSKKKE